MIMAVDIGNTHVCVGTLDGLETKNMYRLQTNIGRTDSEYAVLMHQLMQLTGMDHEHYDGAIISSVVPQLTGVLKSAIKLVTGCDALVVGPGVKTGLNIRIDDPGSLGADLVVGAVAALHKHKPPLILIDMGTATTVSVLDEKGGFLGGAIMAGVNLSLNALNSGTSQLPKIDLHNPGEVIGRNTDECMKSGAVYGTACMIDGMIDRVEKELGQKATVIGTGGLAPVIMRHCTHEILLEDDLLLLGLGVIYQKNIRK